LHRPRSIERELILFRNFEPGRLNPIKLAYVTSWLDGWLH